MDYKTWTHFDGFEEVLLLLDTALANWEDLVTPIDNTDKTPEHQFEKMLQKMYYKYVGAEAQDIQMKNLY
jgi:hypothetical protein